MATGHQFRLLRLNRHVRKNTILAQTAELSPIQSIRPTSDRSATQAKYSVCAQHLAGSTCCILFKILELLRSACISSPWRQMRETSAALGSATQHRCACSMHPPFARFLLLHGHQATQLSRFSQLTVLAVQLELYALARLDQGGGQRIEAMPDEVWRGALGSNP